MEDDQDSSERRTDELFGEGKERARRGGGGKLSRTETVTVRLDPKLNYLCELAARAQRRTKSSFIEWAIENSLGSVGIPGTYFGGKERTIAEKAHELWDVDEADRLIKLGQEASTLLTHDEQVIWKVIQSNSYFWHGRYDEHGEWTSNFTNPSFKTITEHWEDIKRVAAGEMRASELPRAARKAATPAAFDTDLDEFPF